VHPRAGCRGCGPCRWRLRPRLSAWISRSNLESECADYPCSVLRARSHSAGPPMASQNWDVNEAPASCNALANGCILLPSSAESEAPCAVTCKRNRPYPLINYRRQILNSGRAPAAERDAHSRPKSRCVHDLLVRSPNRYSCLPCDLHCGVCVLSRIHLTCANRRPRTPFFRFELLRSMIFSMRRSGRRKTVWCSPCSPSLLDPG